MRAHTPTILAAFLLLLGAPADSRAASARMVGYFANWDIYQGGFFLKDVSTSGAAARLTHLNYAFANVYPDTAGGQVRCRIDDEYADYGRSWTAAESVDGRGTAGNEELRGNFHQLRALKRMHPDLKVMISLGGWTFSRHFSDMARTAASRAAFVQSCVDLFLRGDLPAGENGAGGEGAAAGVFDGIDVDWEFPGTCGEACDQDYALPYTCGDAPVVPLADSENTHVYQQPVCVARPEDKASFTRLLVEFRRQLDALQAETGRAGRYLLTIAAPATPQHYTRLQLDRIHKPLDFINLMAYDLHGPWDTKTNFQSALYPEGAQQGGLTVSGAVRGYLAGGVPPAKLVVGVPFYGRGWKGVPRAGQGMYQQVPGATFDERAAPGTAQAGIEDFKVLNALRQGGSSKRYYDTTTQTAWLYNAASKVLWTFDDVQTVQAKARYVKSQGLGGVMFWELSGDTPGATLVKALSSAVR
jgi:chitinase